MHHCLVIGPGPGSPFRLRRQRFLGFFRSSSIHNRKSSKGARSCLPDAIKLRSVVPFFETVHVQQPKRAVPNGAPLWPRASGHPEALAYRLASSRVGILVGSESSRLAAQTSLTEKSSIGMKRIRPVMPFCLDQNRCPLPFCFNVRLLVALSAFRTPTTMVALSCPLRLRKAEIGLIASRSVHHLNLSVGGGYPLPSNFTRKRSCRGGLITAVSTGNRSAWAWVANALNVVSASAYLHY